jgi:hypothetical protein
MFGITITQVGSAVRSAVIFVGGYFVAKGYISEGDMVAVAGAVAAGASALYGMYLRSKNKLVDAAINASVNATK